MNKELKQLTQQWMTLERKTLEQRKEADNFYDNKMMDLIKKEYVRNNKVNVYEKVEYLVVSVGTSYEPIVLNISLFKPKHILFLYTEKSEETLEKVILLCELSARKYEKRQVNEVDPMDIYREIKRIYLIWKKPERMYIDFTGGTKAMSAACALAGAMIDIQMVYVSTSNYLQDFRKSMPGSEELVHIENPIAVFGDLELEKALVLFERLNFAGAGERLYTLKEKIPDPSIRQQFQFLHLLSEAYEAWDSLNFIPASEKMMLLCQQILRDRKLHKDYLLMDQIERIERQVHILALLKKTAELQMERKQNLILETGELIHALMFTMYQNACTRELQEKYDMATLLMYRLLELIEQRRLIHYKLYASNPDYMHIQYNLRSAPEYGEVPETERFTLLKENVKRIKSTMFKNVDSFLPYQIALMDGYCILAALQDPILNNNKINTVNMLKRIRQMVYLRNNSIFAHGLGPVSFEDYKKFRDFVTELFIDFCKIEHLDYAAYLRDMVWIKPSDSVNYLVGWEA